MEEILEKVSIDIDPSIYYSRGLKAGMRSNFSVDGLPAHLDEIRSELKGKDVLKLEDRAIIKEQISAQNKNFEVEKKVVLKTTRRLNNRISMIEQKVDSYQLLNTNHDFLDHQDHSRYFLPFALGTIILVALTLFLLLFYASTGFSVIFGVPKTGNGILNPDVFAIALSRGGSTLAFVVLFPMLFIAVGFATYIALEKKSNGEKLNGANWTVVSIVLVTLIADMLIGYQISKGIYSRDLIRGLHSEEWTPGMAFGDVNFYLVLVMGFVFYLIWGFLLNYIINNPYREAKIDGDFGYKQMELLENERERLLAKSEKLDLKITLIDHSIYSNNQHLEKLSTNELPHAFAFELCKPLVEKFMDGYKVCMKEAAVTENKALEILKQIDQVYKAWLLKNKS